MAIDECVVDPSGWFNMIHIHLYSRIESKLAPLPSELLPARNRFHCHSSADSLMQSSSCATTQKGPEFGAVNDLFELEVSADQPGFIAPHCGCAVCS